MKEPRGEQIGLEFYFAHPSRADAFLRVVRFCLEHGGTFAGTILQTDGAKARTHRITGIYDRPVTELSIGIDELQTKLEDENSDIIKVAIQSAIGISDDVPEIITYCGASSDASQVDNPSIAILSEGWVFSTPGHEVQARKAGKQCYKRFIQICNALSPVYAAILNEDSLPCRYDLTLGAGKRCFTNFFVSDRAYQTNTITAIENLYKDAYTERLTAGIYISTWSIYNPRGLTIESDVAIERSARIAKVLSKKHG